MTASEHLSKDQFTMTKMGVPYQVSHHAEPGYHSFYAVSPHEDPDEGREGYGRLTVEHTPDQGHVIHDVSIGDDYQGEGVATTLYRHASERLGEVKHSSHMTQDGQQWAAKVGGPHVPGAKTRHVY